MNVIVLAFFGDFHIAG